jgi:hypothetical protein
VSGEQGKVSGENGRMAARASRVAFRISKMPEKRGCQGQDVRRVEEIFFMVAEVERFANYGGGYP